jgi:hypothetical protein
MIRVRREIKMATRVYKDIQMGARKRPNRTFEEIARSGVFDDSPEEVDYVEILGKAQFIHERPTNVYWCGHVGWPGGVRSTSEVAPGSGVLLIETDSEGLARWVIDCINAAVDGVEFAAPRPEGAIFKRGRFRIYEDHKISARSPVRDSMGYGGMVAARSRNAKRLKALARRLNALINAL